MSDNPKFSPLIRSHGRGSESNSSGRFNKTQLQYDISDAGYLDEEDRPNLKTEFFRDDSRTILSKNNSPDIGFTYSINPYRGCEHGCIYCYARPTHEYFDLSAGLDFETKIFVKESAPELLREKFMSCSWRPEAITISGVTDCYQPAERKFQLTRKILEVMAEFRNPVVLITKNQLITRDLDILGDLAQDQLVCAVISVTSLDADLARVLEPRTSTPRARLKAIEDLSKAGVPVSVNVAPTIPGLTDHEMPAILKAAREAGAVSAGYTMVRLPYSVKDLFTEWLEVHQPERKNKVLNALRDVRDGELNNSQFGNRMRGQGPRAEQIGRMFRLFTKKLGFGDNGYSLNTSAFRRPGDQLALFPD